MRKIWPFTLNVLLLGAMAAELPFLVLFYLEAGLNGTQIGLLTGLTPLVNMVGLTAGTSLADAIRRHRGMMTLSILLGILTLAALPLMHTFATILITILLFSFFFGPVFAFTDNATMIMLAGQKELYGRIRLGGTIGFGLFAALTGVIVQNYGLRLAFWLAAGLLVLALLVSQKLVYHANVEQVSVSSGIRQLLTSRRWLLFLLIAFASGIGFSATQSYLLPYLGELGFPESLMGLTLTMGTLSEIPIMFFGNRLIRRFRPYGLLLLATIVTGIRLLIFSASYSVGMVIFLQLLNGLAFPTMWMAAVAYADEQAPPGLGATAQGHLGAMVFGIGPAVGGFLGGPLLESAGGHGLFLTFGIILLATVAIATLGQRLLAQRSSAPGTALD